MTTRTRRTLAALTLVFTLGATAAFADQWLHVRVSESGADGEQVSINIPLGLVEAMLPQIAIDDLDRGMLHLDIDEVDGIDLREIAAALRDTPDGEFVTVRSRDENVRIAKENGMMAVDVEPTRKSDDRVRIRIPIDVFEAMTSPDGTTIDLVAAVRALARHTGDDLVRVESDDETVRIWIDDSETGS